MEYNINVTKKRGVYYLYCPFRVYSQSVCLWLVFAAACVCSAHSSNGSCLGVKGHRAERDTALPSLAFPFNLSIPQYVSSHREQQGSPATPNCQHWVVAATR